MEDGTTPSTHPVLSAVRTGLMRSTKSLPAWLFYDEMGSGLYEQITELPEYYLTRAERAIFDGQSGDIVSRVARGTPAPITVLELGAGSATKTQVLLRAVVAHQGSCHYLPADVSVSALEIATSRIGREETAVQVTPIQGYHQQACEALAHIPPQQLALFIGSSIGNFDAGEAVSLLREVRAALRPGGVLLLGADLAKSEAVLVPAYDDAQGVTAAFNLNLLTRLNRELGAEFDLGTFRHVALWNTAASRIEMHLESLVEQSVWIGQMGGHVHFAEGERIHTESSVKYTEEMVQTLFQASGFTLEHTFYDPQHLFGLHLARV